MKRGKSVNSKFSIELQEMGIKLKISIKMLTKSGQPYLWSRRIMERRWEPIPRQAGSNQEFIKTSPLSYFPWTLIKSIDLSILRILLCILHHTVYTFVVNNSEFNNMKSFMNRRRQIITKKLTLTYLHQITAIKKTIRQIRMVILDFLLLIS